MSQTLAAIYFHIIFSTKHREPLISDDVAPRLFAYLGGITSACHATPILVNGVADHVHVLVEAPATLVLPDYLRTLKANSSKWVHETYPASQHFAWQSGYAAFSVSKSMVPDVKQYVAQQQQHHARVSFQEELIAFLDRHDVAYDPKYIWT